MGESLFVASLRYSRLTISPASTNVRLVIPRLVIRYGPLTGSGARTNVMLIILRIVRLDTLKHDQ
jgi:hypothetical protein